MTLYLLASLAIFIGWIFLVFIFSKIIDVIDKKNSNQLDEILLHRYGIKEINFTESSQITNLYDYFSPEKLANRVSDVVGFICNYLIIIAQPILFLGFVCALFYQIFIHDRSVAILFIFPLMHFTIMVIWLFATYITKLLTNRFPGQASNWRNRINRFSKAI